VRSDGNLALHVGGLTKKGSESLGMLRASWRRYPAMQPGLQLHIAGALHTPMISYGCELWNTRPRETLHRAGANVLRRILGVSDRVAGVAVLWLCGRFPLHVRFMRRVCDSWCWLLAMRQCIMHRSADYAASRRYLFQSCAIKFGLAQLRHEVFAQLRRYQFLPACLTTFGAAPFLAKLLLSDQPLGVERDRYLRPPVLRECRWCRFCLRIGVRAAGDEVHALDVCPSHLGAGAMHGRASMGWAAPRRHHIGHAEVAVRPGWRS
jgi:hypothetical protein